MNISTLGDAFLYGGMFGIIAFTLLYGLRSQWWKYLEGVALMTRSLSLAGIAMLVGLALAFGEFPGRDALRLGIYLFFFIASWFSVGVLVRVQRGNRENRDRLIAELQVAKEREGSDEHSG